jgi:hypothetical protein
MNENISIDNKVNSFGISTIKYTIDEKDSYIQVKFHFSHKNVPASIQLSNTSNTYLLTPIIDNKGNVTIFGVVPALKLSSKDILLDAKKVLKLLQPYYISSQLFEKILQHKEFDKFANIWEDFITQEFPDVFVGTKDTLVSNVDESTDKYHEETILSQISEVINNNPDSLYGLVEESKESEITLNLDSQDYLTFILVPKSGKDLAQVQIKGSFLACYFDVKEIRGEMEIRAPLKTSIKGILPNKYDILDIGKVLKFLRMEDSFFDITMSGRRGCTKDNKCKDLEDVILHHSKFPKLSEMWSKFMLNQFPHLRSNKEDTLSNSVDESHFTTIHQCNSLNILDSLNKTLKEGVENQMQGPIYYFCDPKNANKEIVVSLHLFQKLFEVYVSDGKIVYEMIIDAIKGNPSVIIPNTNIPIIKLPSKNSIFNIKETLQCILKSLSSNSQYPILFNILSGLINHSNLSKLEVMWKKYTHAVFKEEVTKNTTIDSSSVDESYDNLWNWKYLGSKDKGYRLDWELGDPNTTDCYVEGSIYKNDIENICNLSFSDDAHHIIHISFFLSDNGSIGASCCGVVRYFSKSEVAQLDKVIEDLNNNVPYEKVVIEDWSNNAPYEKTIWDIFEKSSIEDPEGCNKLKHYWKQSAQDAFNSPDHSSALLNGVDESLKEDARISMDTPNTYKKYLTIRDNKNPSSTIDVTLFKEVDKCTISFSDEWVRVALSVLIKEGKYCLTCGNTPVIHVSRIECSDLDGLLHKIPEHSVQRLIDRIYSITKSNASKDYDDVKRCWKQTVQEVFGVGNRSDSLNTNAVDESESYDWSSDLWSWKSFSKEDRGYRLYYKLGDSSEPDSFVEGSIYKNDVDNTCSIYFSNDYAEEVLFFLNADGIVCANYDGSVKSFSKLEAKSLDMVLKGLGLKGSDDSLWISVRKSIFKDPKGYAKLKYYWNQAIQDTFISPDKFTTMLGGVDESSIEARIASFLKHV